MSDKPLRSYAAALLLMLSGCAPYPAVGTPTWPARCGGVSDDELRLYRELALRSVVRQSPRSFERFTELSTSLAECPRRLLRYYEKVAEI